MPDAYVQAAKSLKAPEYFHGKKHLEDLQFSVDGADPRIVKFARAVLSDAARHGIPLRVHTIWRSPEDQRLAYVAGRSRAKPGESPHNVGRAVDIIHATRGWNLDEMEWEFLAVICRETARRQNLKLDWGGEWHRLYDPAHWQLKVWRNNPFIPHTPKEVEQSTAYLKHYQA